METSKVLQIPPERPQEKQLSFERDALLLWLTRLREKPSFGPVPGRNGQWPVPEGLYGDLMQKTIQKYSLKSVEQMLQETLPVESETASVIKSLLKWGPSHGGFPGPHLHFEGKVFILTENQWETFSREALKTLTQKLSTVSKVSFDDFSNMTTAAAPVLAG